MSKNWRSFPRLESWEWIGVGFAVVNFFAFVGIGEWLGGSAANGFVEGGHYFLGEHGHFTEVSKRVFTYSQNHLRLMILTHTLAFGVLLWAKVREMMKGEQDE